MIGIGLTPFASRGGSGGLSPVELGTVIDFDFTTAGSLSDFTQVKPNTTVSLTGGHLRAVQSPATANFTNYITYDAYGSTNLNKWVMETVVIPKDLTATSYGVSLGIKRTQGYESSPDYIGFLEMDSGAYKGLLAIYTSNPFALIVGSATNLSFSLNDRIKLTFERNLNVLTLTAVNLTSASTATVTYTIAYAFPSSPYRFAAQIGKPTIYFSGGTQDFEYLTYSSTCKKNVHVTYFGDSITWGYGTTVIANSFPNRIMSGSSKQYNVCGSPGATSADLVLCLNEMALLNSTYNVLCIGVNDQGLGVSVPTTKTNLEALLAGLGGTKILNYLIPFGTNDPATFNAMIDTIATGPIPDLTTVLGTGTPKYPNPSLYTVDLIHPNDAGADVIDDEFLLKYPQLA